MGREQGLFMVRELTTNRLFGPGRDTGGRRLTVARVRTKLSQTGLGQAGLQPRIPTMKSIEQWFSEYGEIHQNPTNKLLHWICAPLLTFSLLGMFWALHPYVMLCFMALSLLFYLSLSLRMSVAMAVLTGLMAFIFSRMQTLFWPCLMIFLLAWVGQFIGQHVEGRKPSFHKDLQFVLIGPLWVVSFVFRKLGVTY